MKKSAIYFTRIAALTTPGYAILAGHMVDQGNSPTFTRISRISSTREWAFIQDIPNELIYDLSVSGTKNPQGKSKIYALGRDGLVRIFQSGTPPQDLYIPLKDSTSYMESLHITDDAIYVCGGQNQIYKYKNGTWFSIDDNLYEKFDGKNDLAIFEITEISHDVLICVGKNGLAAIKHNENPWEKLNTPTNLDFKTVISDKKGGAWLAGDGGVLFKLSPDGTWDDYTDPEFSSNTFEHIALHKEHLFIAAGDKFLQLTEGKITSVAGPFKKHSEFHHLSSQGDYLWATGGTNVYQLGQNGWELYTCPDNE